jgi:hypothetical protein
VGVAVQPIRRRAAAVGYFSFDIAIDRLDVALAPDETRELGPDADALILSQGAEELLSAEQREGAC